MTPELEALWTSGNMLRLLDYYTEKAARESEARRAAIEAPTISDHCQHDGEPVGAPDCTQEGV